MIKKRLQDIVLLTRDVYLQYNVHVLTAISGCIIDIANGSSSYKSRFSHAKALFFWRSFEASNGVYWFANLSQIFTN